MTPTRHHPGVAVTGVGLVTCRGTGKGPALLVDPAPTLDGPGATDFRIGDIDWGPLAGRRGLRTFGRDSRIFLLAALLACEDAALDIEGFDGERLGIFCGTTRAGLEDYFDLYHAGVRDGPGGINPAQGPQTGFNAPAGNAAVQLGAQGPNITMSAGSASSSAAISEGRLHVLDRHVDVALAGGVDVLPGFVDLGPGGRVVPLGQRPGEAAAVVVLERSGDAGARSVPARAHVGAVAIAFDPADGKAAARRAMADAIKESGAPCVGAAVISAPAQGIDDTAEAQSVRSLTPSAEVFSVCDAVGATGGVSGAVQLAFACHLLGRGLPLDAVLVSTLDPTGVASAVVVTGPER